MKTFYCNHCSNRVFFENTSCLNCGAQLAFSPETLQMRALQEPGGPALKVCENYSSNNICNWCVPGEDPQTLCRSCRLTRVIPDLSAPGNLLAWSKLETAKRRALYTSLLLQLPLEELSFRFMQDQAESSSDQARVLTGHNNGVITVNIAEADDVYREQQRTWQHEPHRTLLGHFRHELGHYYWDRLIKDRKDRLQAFRQVFGDERADYAGALQRHYTQGPPQDWPEHFISAYASMHPWEDWAESWVHVMHMVDALESAQNMQVSLTTDEAHDPLSAATRAWAAGRLPAFDALNKAWGTLTYMLNNLTRGLGLPDGYPFVLSATSIGKLRFIYDLL